MTVIEGIKKGLAQGNSSIDLARKIFLSYQSYAFNGKEDIEFEIKDSIKKHLKIPFISIQTAGSAKSGFSFFKQTLFTEGKSDLDISIISLELYNKFLEIAHAETEGFTKLTVFPMYKGRKTDQQFINSIKKGYINPFFMPDCKEKSEWLAFFRHLSNDYFRLFKGINAGIYASEYFFEYKQSDCIDKFKGDMNIYDSLSSKV
jgi:hypothetical protein